MIVLSGRGTEADRLRGFAEGADDYVVKPFHYAEVVGPDPGRAAPRATRGAKGRGRVGDVFIDPSATRGEGGRAGG